MSQQESLARLNKSLEDHILALVLVCHQRGKDAGWWHDLHTGEPLNRNKAESIALMHSELSEMLEGVRKSLPDDHCPEFKVYLMTIALNSLQKKLSWPMC